jgi:diketogulonate reductase-like aldo/keto reductase
MLTRRQLLQSVSLAACAGLPALSTSATDHAYGVIPSSGERIAAIGMGSWLTFDVAESKPALKIRSAVLDAFFAGGGSLIDSSPMYGSSQAALGHCLRRLQHPDALFSATKVWTPSAWLGERQMENAHGLWGVERFDLLQIHNLLKWEAHLETLLEWRGTGRVRYIGVTTSHGRRHADLLKIIRSQPIDFVQLTYNIRDREAEHELLPAAQEAGIAVIANRPFAGSRLFDKVRRAAMPVWANDFDCANWAQLFLKFVISHPAITCAIPATSRVDHMQENIGALRGRLPNEGQRRAMALYYAGQ